MKSVFSLRKKEKNEKGGDNVINLSSILADVTKMTSFIGSVFADITELPQIFSPF